jgi:hypothetical protein
MVPAGVGTPIKSQQFMTGCNERLNDLEPINYLIRRKARLLVKFYQSLMISDSARARDRKSLA